MIGFLVDGAAIVNQVINSKGSYGPYCRALERICYEESFHLKQGHDNFVYLATGTKKQREMLQEALNRWYIPLLHFFGPPDKESVHGKKLMKWKVKLASNDDMRNQFLDQYVPKIYELGLTLPDDKLGKNKETGVWEFSDPDWQEFFKVVNGDGPCNKEGHRHVPGRRAGRHFCGLVAEREKKGGDELFERDPERLVGGVGRGWEQGEAGLFQGGQAGGGAFRDVVLNRLASGLGFPFPKRP